MSYDYTSNVKFPIGGGLYLASGTFTDAATAGSSVVTGLAKVLVCFAQNTVAAAVGCKESATAGTLTIYATNNGSDDGFWLAIGR